MPERLIVIGGDAAGMSAASQARRRRDADDLEIIAFEQSDWVSYSACGEPYYLSGAVPELSQLVARTPEQFWEQNIDARLRHRVTAIDTTTKTVEVDHPDGTASFGYDQLVYATGAVPITPPVNGVDADGVYSLKTLDDAETIKKAMTGARRGIVIGGGYIGLEVAEAFREQGLDTMLITSGIGVMNRSLDPDMANLATEQIQATGLRVLTNSRIKDIATEDGRVTGVQCEEFYPADIIVLGLGTKPEVALASAAGIPLGPTGAVAVDERQRTAIPGVWAAGDCAEAFHRVSGQPANVHLGTVANKQGRVAGINLGGDDATFPGILGTAITKYMDVEIARTGLTEEEAAAAGFDAAAATTSSTTTAGYWPAAAKLWIKVVAERSTGRLLGAQIVGGPGAGKRIDVLAAGIWNEMDGHSFSMMDLSYAPPFSGVWDAVLIAARKAADSAT